MVELSERMTRFSSSVSQDANKRARQMREAGKELVMMSIGEPDFATPRNIKQAASDAMLRDDTHYTNTDGTSTLKRAVREKFRRENGLDYSDTEVMVSNGAKQIIYNAIMATVGPGDEVIIPTPCWVSYPDIVQLAGGTPVMLPCRQENRFRVDPNELRKLLSVRTKWLVLNSPNNPSGAVYSQGNLKSITDVLLDHPKAGIISDEIYEHLIYDGNKFASPAAVEPELFDRILTVNGVSKAYAMTGWRIGYAGGPANLIGAMSKLQGQCTSGASSISQAAAAEALSGPQDVLVEFRSIMQRRRNKICDILDTCSDLSFIRPEGAMYVYVNCSGIIGKRTPLGKILDSDSDVTEYFLDAAGVALINGKAYGMSPYFRLSFPLEEEQLAEGGRRIVEACNALLKA